MMPKTYQDLIGLTKDDLIKLYNQEAPRVGIDLRFIMQEFWRRDADQLNRRIEKMTNQMRWFTVAIVFLTALTLGIFVYDVFFR